MAPEDTIRPRIDENVASRVTEHADRLTTAVDVDELTWSQRVRIVVDRLDELDDDGSTDTTDDDRDETHGGEESDGPIVTREDLREAVADAEVTRSPGGFYGSRSR